MKRLDSLGTALLLLELANAVPSFWPSFCRNLVDEMKSDLNVYKLLKIQFSVFFRRKKFEMERCHRFCRMN